MKRLTRKRPPTKIILHHGDALRVLRSLPDNSIDSVVTDPPYGLSNAKPELIIKALTAWITGDRDHVPDGRGFMGKKWDAFVPPPAVWDECFRVLKPGGHMLVFAGTRAHDLMQISIRLAGFEVRDSLAWIYGSGFPKSLDVGKAIDKAAGAERERVPGTGGMHRGVLNAAPDATGSHIWTAQQTSATPTTDDARTWQGWGTALKPAHEPIVMARKPLQKGSTIARNVLDHGTGALNVDACRVGTDARSFVSKGIRPGSGNYIGDDWQPDNDATTVAGRWPPNVLLDQDMADDLDRQSGTSTSNIRPPTGRDERGVPNTESQMIMRRNDTSQRGHADSGGASRFFPVFKYQAKAPKKERPRSSTGASHPTVKPLELIKWLIKLITPPGGTVLDPFCGSGTAGEAALLEGFNAIMIDNDLDSIELTKIRMSKHSQELIMGRPLHPKRELIYRPTSPDKGGTKGRVERILPAPPPNKRSLKIRS